MEVICHYYYHYYYFLNTEVPIDVDRQLNRLDLLSDYHNYDYDNRGCETEYPNMRPLITIADYIAYADDYPDFCGDVRVLVCVGFVVFHGYQWPTVVSSISHPLFS